MFYTTVGKIIKELNLECLTEISNIEERKIKDMNLNRPALQLMGFFEYFDEQRVQIIGISEMAYLKTMTKHREETQLRNFSKRHPLCDNYIKPGAI